MHVCKLCKALEGYTKTFETGKDKFPEVLTHPDYGVVWNVKLDAQTHIHLNDKCRCTLKTEFDISDIIIGKFDFPQ